jgi:hypothetical protein
MEAMLMQRICIVPLVAPLVLAAAVGPGAATNLPTYPKDILGAWTPDGTPCGKPINYDSETLLLIEESIIGQYENTNRPIEVRRLSSRPKVWKVVSQASPGSGEYSGRYTEIFVLSGIKLTIVSEKESSIFVRCE